MSNYENNGPAPSSEGQEAPRPTGYTTLAVHAGRLPPQVGTVPTNVPIYATSTFLSESTQALDEVFEGTRQGYVYGRYGNPTVSALETAVSALEGAGATVAFSSGMAALHGALLLCELAPGSVVLAGTDLYGASHTLLGTLLGQFDVRARFVDVTDPQAVESALVETPRPRAILFETISNPLMKVADVAWLCTLARAAGVTSIVDSTFTPPPLMQPLAHGADIVVHSATKYYGGHGDVTGGLVCLRDPAQEGTLRQISKLAGSILGPFEAFLINRGVKTLTLRIERQCENAVGLASWLSEYPGVARVYYPGLPDHPQHELAARLLSGPHPGAMLAFEIEGAGREEVFQLFDAFQMVLPATTLGDIYTEVSYPVMSSHREWSPAQLRSAGITPSLVRVSCGIEDIGDIIADFEHALAQAVPSWRPADAENETQTERPLT
jgi:cystathionine beta-lyase/cystathionine gamma-synthase